MKKKEKKKLKIKIIEQNKKPKNSITLDDFYSGIKYNYKY